VCVCVCVCVCVYDNDCTLVMKNPGSLSVDLLSTYGSLFSLVNL